MKRRDFFSQSALAATGTLISGSSVFTSANTTDPSTFKLKFAPHIGLTSPEDGMFIHSAGKDPVDQIKFIAEQGFRGIEDNFMKIRPRHQQEAIAQELSRQGMELGCFVHNTDTWQDTALVSRPKEVKDRLIKEVQATIETAKRVNGKYTTLLSGLQNPRLERQYQKVNLIENLKYLGDLAARAGIVLGLEAINGKEFPNTFITKVTDAYEVVKAVDSPGVKLIFDIYHVQIEQGDLIRNIDQTWDEIAYFHVADNPGRSEPGSGEINYGKVLQHIYEKGYTGFIDMEHISTQSGKAGEQAILRIYQELNEGLG